VLGEPTHIVEELLQLEHRLRDLLDILVPLLHLPVGDPGVGISGRGGELDCVLSEMTNPR